MVRAGARPGAHPLRLRQLVEHLVDRAPDEVAEARERQPRLGLRGPCLEYAVAALARFLHGGEPERRLARSGLPLDHEPARASDKRVEESRRSRQLRVPPDHLGRGHAPRRGTPSAVSARDTKLRVGTVRGTDGCQTSRKGVTSMASSYPGRGVR